MFDLHKSKMSEVHVCPVCGHKRMKVSLYGPEHAKLTELLMKLKENTRPA